MRSGFTLIEIVAVTVVLGLIAGIGVPSLVRRVAHDGSAQTIAELQSFTQQAISFAQGQGATAHLAMNDFSIADAQEHPVITATWDRACEVTWRDERGQQALTWTWDHRGRSADGTIDIRHRGKLERYRFLGLTGEWLQDESTP